jgi:hypothetical protein
MLSRPLSSRPISTKSSKIAVALLASVAVAAMGVSTDALAQHGGHGGGGGGGGGFHGGGGGGGFHMGGGGGGGFHMGGGGGGFHMGGGGGGFHMGGGGGGFRSFAGVPRGGVHTFAGVNRGNAGPSFSGRSVGGHAFAGRPSGGQTFTRHGNVWRSSPGQGIAATHNAVTAHPQLGGANQLNTRGQFAHDRIGRNQFANERFAHNQFVHNQLAHNQFVARNFHGLYNFNHAGFNRNAFGDPSHWNRWGGRFWGAGWNRWGHGFGGWAGPVFWPYLYGDIFSFAFWPYDYYDPFWAYGPDFLLASIFAPGPYFGADYGYAPDYAAGYAGGNDIYYGGYSGPSSGPGAVTNADRQALAETNAAAAESCSGLAPGVTDLPIAQIKQTVRPTGDQLTALDDLSAAAAKANDVVKSSCPTAMPLTPAARLDAAQARLEAVIKAVDIVRGPLQKFYDSLSDEQRQRFDAMGNTGNGRTAAGGNVAALCGQQSGDVADLPVQRIEQVVQPNGEQQQQAFDALKQASRDAAQQLQSSCPAQVPQTPVARLDAVKTRLQAMVEAMNTVRPKLQAFYASLTDDQKARFNTMGPPQQSASSTPEQKGNGR